MIYFMRAGPVGHVKIGWTKDAKTLASRVKMLQIGQPFPLQIIRTIDAERWVERWLHEFFSGVRASGEWFEYSESMFSVEPPALFPSRRKPKPAHRQSELEWRTYLTDDERGVLDQVEVAKVAWEGLSDQRARVVNRAIQRARYALGRRDGVPATEATLTPRPKP